MEFARPPQNQKAIAEIHAPVFHDWEHALLEKARAGFVERIAATREHLIRSTHLVKAYAHCEQITRSHSKTFFMATALLPPAKRQAIRALYAFCRSCDDLMDMPSSSDSLQDLDAWRMRTTCLTTNETDLIALAWNDTRLKYSIPSLYAEQLIEGVRTDWYTGRYQTFADLADYCYAVASTVGLMSMHVIGFTDQRALLYAIRLGVALQLTNILRDVGEDWRMGRLYLPREELIFHGIREEDIDAGRVTENWRQFMTFQIARARELYRTSLPGVRFLDPSGRFATAAAGRLYELILDEIERNDYDVFHHRAHTSLFTKLKHLPGIWWHSR
jgi:phytoene synthase